MFHDRRWPQYIAIAEVERERREVDQDARHIARHGRSTLDDLFNRFDQAREDDHGDIRRRHEPNPWLEFTMWEGHIGRHKDWVVEMIKPEPVVPKRVRANVNGRSGPNSTTDPSGSESGSGGEGRSGVGQPMDDDVGSGWRLDAESENALAQACKATMRLIRRSYSASRMDIVGRPAMQYVNRRETGAPSSDKPFYGRQKVQTIRRYADHFERILRYMWRTEAMIERPPYRLTSTQRKVLGQLRRVAERVAEEQQVRAGGSSVRRRRGERVADSRVQLVEVSLAFWIAMFDHRLGDDEYENGVLSGLAVLGACGEKGGWMPAITYTPTLAGVITTMRAIVITTMRAIVIRRAWRRRADQVALNVRNGIEARHAHEGVPSVFGGVKADVERFMTSTAFGRHPTPMNTIYTQKMYGMKIRYTTKAEGQVSWEGEETVLVRKIMFSISDIRSIAHGLVAATRQQFVRDLLVMRPSSSPHDWRLEELPRFDMGQIRDNPRVFAAGWNLLQDVRNTWPVDGDRWMGRRLFEKGELRKRFMRNPDEAAAACHPEAVERYLRDVRRFKEKLIILVHISVGAPARSTELTSVQCENGKDARSQRGIFVDDGMVAFVTTYHKGYSASQSMKTVHRFVPEEVGEIVVYYMWLVRPFERILQGLDRGQELFSTWMCQPAPEERWGVDEDDIDVQDEGYESDREADVPVTEGWDDADDVSGEDVDEVEAVQAAQASTEPPQARNSDGFWTTDRVRRVMRRETAGLIGVPIGISDWRQVYPAIHREFAIDHGIRDTLQRIYSNPNAHATPDESAGDAVRTIQGVRTQQSGHSFQMEEDIYGRSLEQSPFTTIAEVEAFRKVSVDWHRFLQFPSAWKRDDRDPDVRRRVKQERDAAQYAR